MGWSLNSSSHLLQDCISPASVVCFGWNLPCSPEYSHCRFLVGVSTQQPRMAMELKRPNHMRPGTTLTSNCTSEAWPLFQAEILQTPPLSFTSVILNWVVWKLSLMPPCCSPSLLPSCWTFQPILSSACSRIQANTLLSNVTLDKLITKLDTTTKRFYRVPCFNKK